MTVRIAGERVVLRDIVRGDLQDLYYHYYESPDREHLNWNGPYTPQVHTDFEDFARKFDGDLAIAEGGEESAAREMLIIEIDGELKGKVGRYWVSQETNWFEIGIVLFDSRFWSGGYGSEAFRLWIDYLFGAMDTVRLGIGTWSGNERMMRLAARCGMKPEARVRKARIVRGEYYDAIKMGILREEWEALKEHREGPAGAPGAAPQTRDSAIGAETGAIGVETGAISAETAAIAAGRSAPSSSAGGRCDLHTHTLASDGMQPPAENVRLAAGRGLAAVAITDHDTVAGVAEALEAGERLGVVVVPGVEISTRAGGKDIHILGYCIDWQDPVFLQRLKGLRDTRDARNGQILARLRELGIAITMEGVLRGLGRELKPDESLGRPHIADELVRLGAARDMRDAFDKYLAEGKPAFVPVPRITPAEACAWIAEAGGRAVLAHPGLYGDDGLVRDILREGGFAGIEAYHSDHGPAENERYLAMAEEYGLLVTGGSDYHGARGGVVFHGELGGVTVDAGVLERLRPQAGPES